MQLYLKLIDANGSHLKDKGTHVIIEVEESCSVDVKDGIEWMPASK